MADVSKMVNTKSGVEQMVAREAHNLEIAGSSPAPANPKMPFPPLCPSYNAPNRFDDVCGLLLVTLFVAAIASLGYIAGWCGHIDYTHKHPLTSQPRNTPPVGQQRR